MALRRTPTMPMLRSCDCAPERLSLPRCASECDPCECKESVVIRRVSAGAVVIGYGTIEPVVVHVLQPELHIEPRPERWSAIVEGDVIEFQSVAICRRLVGGRYCPVEQRVAGPLRLDISGGQTDGLLGIVSAFPVVTAQTVVAVGGTAQRMSRRLVRVLVDVACLHRETVARAEELVLGIEADIGEAIGAATGHSLRHHR